MFHNKFRMSSRLLGMSMLTGLLFTFATLNQAFAQQLQGPQDLSAAQLTGSWLVTYDVPAFVIPIPILLSFTGEGIVIETDSPAPTPFGGSIGTLFLSNGHGSWKPTGKNQFAYTYRKILYAANGNPFGLVRTNGAVTLSKDGTQLHATLDIRFTDNNGSILFTATGTAAGGRIEVERQY